MRLLAVLFAMLLAACAQPRPANEVILTYASPYPPTHPFSRADIAWMHWVERASGGRLRIEPFWAGSLLSSDQSMVEIRHGVADIGLVTPIYTRGGAHMLRVQSGFYGGVRSIADQIAIYDCLAARFPQFGAELTGLHVLAVQGGNFPGVLTRTRPVHALADLRGLRLRSPSETTDVLENLGVDPVNMPMGEVYSALAKGVIDGVVAPIDTVKSLHFSEVASHFAPLRVSRGGYPARAISDRALRRLPPDLQALLLRSRRVWEAALNREILAAEQAGIEFARAHHMRIDPFDPREQARFDALYNARAEDQARRLASVRLDGAPVLAAAQTLIREAGASKPIVCPVNRGTPS